MLVFESDNTVTFTKDQLIKVGTAILEAAGINTEDAKLTTDLLVKSNLAGHHGHGIGTIKEIVNDIKEGKIKPENDIVILKESDSTALIDANRCPAHVVSIKCMKLAIKKAEKHNVGVVSYLNTTPTGRIADYVLLASSHNMIGMMWVDGYPGLVVPFGGAEPLLNTSPIAVAIPCGEEETFLMDFATSICSAGKVGLAREEGKLMPSGYIVDKNGNPSRDPSKNYGGILPLGGPAGYKGTGLVLWVDMMAGILSGRGPAHFSDVRTRGSGVTIIVLKIEAFRPIEEFKREADRLMRAIRDSKKAPGVSRIMMPGEIEWENERSQLRTGVKLSEKYWNNRVVAVAKEVNVNIEELLKEK
jgi:LDH2 family malate/lactate/ureidoglycolate dehydrogenase